MRRRGILALLGGSGLVGLGGIATAKPELLVGSPRGEGDAVSAERTVRDDSVEYLPASDAVRYPTAMGPDGPAEHETQPFEAWADRKCASVGSDAILPALRERFGAALRGIGTALTSEFLVGTVIRVSATTVRNRAGEVVGEPIVSFRALVERTPRTVRVTVTLAGRDHSRSVPVFVERSERVNL